MVNIGANIRPVSLPKTDFRAVAIAKDSKGSLVAADAKQQIKWFDDKSQRWTNAKTYEGELVGLVFTSQNRCLAITRQGIFDTDTRRMHFPDSSLYLNNQIRNKRVWFGTPTYLIDKQDRIWVGFDYGEWGGDVFAYDSDRMRYIPLTINSVNMNKNPVYAFCEDQQSVYMAGGLGHMFMTHGSILTFTNATAWLLLQSLDLPQKDTIQIMGKTQIVTRHQGGEQIGPIAFVPATNCLYYYSQSGLHKGVIGTDLSDIRNWPVILNPPLRREGGRSNAVGSTISVLKMQSAPDGSLLMLTQHEGLGIYDGKRIRFVKPD